MAGVISPEANADAPACGNRWVSLFRPQSRFPNGFGFSVRHFQGSLCFVYFCARASLRSVPFCVYVSATDLSETDLDILAVVELVVSLSLVYIRKFPEVFACHACTSNLVGLDSEAQC